MLWGRHTVSCQTAAQGKDVYHSFPKEVPGTAPKNQTGPDSSPGSSSSLLCDLGQIT